MNNGGWSLQLMLFFCAVLILGLFISASILANNFNQSSSNSSNTQQFSYSDLEVRLINSSKKYINAYYQNALTDNADFTVIVSSNTLKQENYLTKLMNPKNQKECIGYVIFKKVDNYFHYDGYINCNPNYKTEGYQEEYENY